MYVNDVLASKKKIFNSCLLKFFQPEETEPEAVESAWLIRPKLLLVYAAAEEDSRLMGQKDPKDLTNTCP